MMELIVAILIALGSLTSQADFTEDFQASHQDEISNIQSIIDNGQYQIDERNGGVVVDPGIGL